MGHDVCRQPLQHQQNLRSTADIRVDGDWKHRLVIFPIDKIKLVSPHLLYVSRIGETMAVRSLLEEHHRRQVVQVPVGRNLHQVRFFSPYQGVHPILGRLGVVDFGPAVTLPHIIAFKIPMHQTVVVLYAVLLQQLVGDVTEDMAKCEGGNKAAGTRVRKSMQDIKAAAQDVRKDVLNLRNSDG